MKIPAPKSAYSHRKRGTWEEFVFALYEHTDTLTLTYWWGRTSTKEMVAEMPPLWQELAEEKYFDRLDELRDGR